VAPTATCQILLKNATSRHFWKEVPSLLRTTIRTRIRICHKNIHPRSFQNFKFVTFSKFQNQNKCYIGLKLRVFALDLNFLQTKDRKTRFLGPKTRQLSKTPGNIRKRTGTSQNTRGASQTHPELPKHTRGTSQTYSELPKHTQNFPKTPGTSPNVPGTSQNTRGTSKHPGNFPKTPG
jgi:hypothetical protein